MMKPAIIIAAASVIVCVIAGLGLFMVRARPVHGQATRSALLPEPVPRVQPAKLAPLRAPHARKNQPSAAAVPIERKRLGDLMANPAFRAWAEREYKGNRPIEQTLNDVQFKVDVLDRLGECLGDYDTGATAIRVNVYPTPDHQMTVVQSAEVLGVSGFPDEDLEQLNYCATNVLMGLSRPIAGDETLREAVGMPIRLDFPMSNHPAMKTYEKLMAKAAELGL